MIKKGLEKILKGFGKRIVTAGLVSSLLFLSCSEDSKLTSPVNNSSPPTAPKNPTSPQPNRPPVIISSPITSVSEREYYIYQIQSTDADGDVLNYYLNKSPSWLMVTNNWVCGWSPEVQTDQTFNIELVASDNKLTTTQNYNLTVKNVSNSYLLSSSQLSGAAVTDNSISLSQPISFAVGDIIGSGVTSSTPNGLLRQITSISSDKKTMQTTQATLEDVTSNAFFTYNGRLSSSSVIYSSTLDGVKMSHPSLSSTKGFNFNINLSNVVLYDRDGNKNTKDDQLIANGNISFDNDVTFHVNVLNYKIRDIVFRNSTFIESDVTVGASTIGVASSSSVKIAEYKFNPITVGYFPPPIPIPIIVVPTLSVYAGINPVNINPLSLRVKQIANLETFLTYNSISGWNSGSNFSNNFTFSNPAVNGNLELKVSAGPQLELMVYGTAGPTAEVSGKLRFKVSNNAKNWELYGGIGASIGAKLQILKKGLSAQLVEVINYEKLLTSYSEPTPPPTQNIITIQPGAEGKDSYIKYVLWPDGSKSYSGSGDDALINFSREYFGTHGVEEAGLIEFPLSKIPENINITSAKLMLYGKATTNSLSDLPTINISEIEGPWQESNVKWDNQPPTSFFSEIDFVKQGQECWYEIDVTSLVKRWKSGEQNYGFSFWTRENDVRGLIYSGDNPDSTKRPKLIVSYY